MVFGVEEQKPAAAGSHQLSPHPPVPQAQFVPLVDVGVTHAARAPLLLLPLLVHQLAESPKVALQQRTSRAQTECLDVLQIRQHIAVMPFASLLLIGEDAARAPREAREEE